MVEPSALAGLGRTPIPGAAPAGESATEDEAFDQLRAEVLKDPVREVTDWGKVVPLATRILEQRSKDFTAASYLTVALLETRGYAGLLDGIAILEGMHQTFWDDGFPPVPKRLRGRANAIQWLVERGATWIGRKGAQPSDREVLTACLQACESLDKVVADRFTEGDVGTGALIRALREQLERLPAPDQPAPAEPAPEPAQSAAPAAAPPPAAPASAGDLEIRSQSDAQTLVFKTAAFLRQKEPASAVPIRLVRVFRWAGIAAAPPVTDGKTQIIPPSAETAAALRRLHDARDWAGLFEAAEDAFRQGSPLWLDLQRYSATALENLGPGHAAVRDGLIEEVRALLRRLPSLPDLRFRDDTPFADPETRVWIAESLGQEAPASSSRPAGSGAPVAEGIDPAVAAQALQDARRLVKAGDLRGALDALAGTVAQPGTLRGDFLMRLEIASLCAELGRDRLAAPMLQALDAMVCAHGLETWEPALATRVLESLYRSTKRLAGQRGAAPELAGRAEELFARLCRIDPAAAAGID